MFKLIKRFIFSSLSILGISLLIWTVFLLNPSLSYANQTNYEHVTVYHNNDLEPETEVILRHAVSLIKQSDLFTEDTHIKFCMNDSKVFIRLNPLVGEALGYAYFDMAVMKNGTFSFAENKIETRWASNDFEYRKFDLTTLIAHEMMHNLQCAADQKYWMRSTMGKLNWKLEGHAEYIVRGFKNDGQLGKKIDRYLFESAKEKKGYPVFEYEDGTKQILPYYKYALIVQYLMDVKDLTFEALCALEADQDVIYEEMLEWKRANSDI